MLRISRIIVKSSVVILATLVLICISAWAYDRYAARQALLSYSPPGQFLNIKGQKMHYLCQGGQEPTLVLLHGYGGGAIDFLPLMEALPPGQRVCAFDRFGSDYSDILKGKQSASNLVENLHSAIEFLEIDTPIVVGHSLGGAIAQLYATSYPVQGIVLLDGLSADVANDVTTRLGSYNALRFLAQVGLLRPLAPSFVHPSYKDELRQQMLSLRSRGSAITSMAQEGRIAQTGVTSDILFENEAHIKVPLLIIAAGETDVPEGAAFSESLEALHKRHPRSTYHVIPEASHYVMVSHAEQTVAYITAWLETIIR